jgi:hypothetical protein
VGLAAAEMERLGISTVSLQLLHKAEGGIVAPRSLWVPFWHGYALGDPGDAAGQHAVIDSALALLADGRAGFGVWREFTGR